MGVYTILKNISFFLVEETEENQPTCRKSRTNIIFVRISTGGNRKTWIWTDHLTGEKGEVLCFWHETKSLFLHGTFETD